MVSCYITKGNSCTLKLQDVNPNKDHRSYGDPGVVMGLPGAVVCCFKFRPTPRFCQVLIAMLLLSCVCAALSWMQYRMTDAPVFTATIDR